MGAGARENRGRQAGAEKAESGIPKMAGTGGEKEKNFAIFRNISQ